MAGRRRKPAVDADAVLKRILRDVQGDDEQLWALIDAMSGAFALPVDVHVVGEPLKLVSVSYEGNPRRELVARCGREDGSTFQVSFADVQMAPNAAAFPWLAAYCKWVGVEPVGAPRSRGPRAKVRGHKASEDDIDLSRPVKLVVLAVKQTAARCRLVGSDRAITLRAGSVTQVVPGQIIAVQPGKQWRHQGHPYLSGKITPTRIDARALGLTPLALNARGEWDPAEEYWGEEDEPIESWARPIIARGPRPMFEMEQVLPGSDAEDFDFDSDPILYSTDLREAGDTAGAAEVLSKLLEEDLRCLDAHAHLGNLVFRASAHWALDHYEVGVRIGELSLGVDFDGVLAWGLIDNRPFLRCMEGYGLCLWRLERWDEAERVFERMLWLNPSDNQGIRALLPEVQAREPWFDDEA
jgi:hypothetical protein